MSRSQFSLIWAGALTRLGKEAPLSLPVPAKAPRKPGKVKKAAPAKPSPITAIVPPSADSILEALCLGDEAAQEIRGEDNGLHVSTLLRACPRSLVLAGRYGHTVPVQTVDRGMRVLWEMGRAAERFVRATLIADSPETAFGDWHCPCYISYDRGTTRAEQEGKVCRCCALSVTIYAEHVMQVEGITGSPDFIIKAQEDYYPVEVKSTNLKGLADIDKAKAPNGDHASQVHSYRELLLAEGKSVPHCFVIYVSKEYQWGKVPYRIFASHPKRSLSATWGVMKATAEEVRLGKADPTRALPARLSACGNPNTTQAKACSTCNLCFSFHD